MPPATWWSPARIGSYVTRWSFTGLTQSSGVAVLVGSPTALALPVVGAVVWNQVLRPSEERFLAAVRRAARGVPACGALLGAALAALPALICQAVRPMARRAVPWRVMPLAVQTPTLIFDGDCAFCTSAARWASSRWIRPAEAIAWQRLRVERLAELGLSEWDVRHAAYWVDSDGTLARGYAAVARALNAGTGWMRVAGRVLSVPPGSWIARPAYWLIARYRHRLPGATDACRI